MGQPNHRDRCSALHAKRLKRWLGRALGEQSEYAQHQQTTGSQRACLRKGRHAQPHRQRWPGNKAQLIEHGLQRISGLQLRRSPVQRRPAGTQHRRHAGHGPGQHRAGKQGPIGQRPPGGRQQQHQAGHTDAGGQRQHAALAMAVHQARCLRRQQRITEHKGGRDCASESIAAAQLGQHGDDADAHHRQRQAGKQPSQAKARAAGRGKNCSVGLEHGFFLRPACQHGPG